MIAENNNLEFKRELTDSIVKEIIAFCNTTGGTIILGYDDNGKVVGLKNAKEDLDRLSSKINDSIEPSVNFLVSSRIEREDNKEIIEVVHNDEDSFLSLFDSFSSNYLKITKVYVHDKDEIMSKFNLQEEEFEKCFDKETNVLTLRSYD